MIKEYPLHGVCARSVRYRIDGTKITGVEFIGGCSGNTQGIARLVEGMDAEAVITRLKGIRCGFKKTSCPDQLARTIEKALNDQ